MKVYDKIKDMLCDELETISKQKELSQGNLEIVDTAIDIIKDIHTIEAMEQEYGHDDGYSQGYYGRMPYYIYDDGMMPTGGSYARGRGGNVPRDMRGRYMSDNGYSRDTKDELQQLMNNAQNEHEREAIRRALDSMK